MSITREPKQDLNHGSRGGAPAGRLELRFEPESQFTSDFVPLAPPAAVRLVTDHLTGDCVDHLHTELNVNLRPGSYAFGVTDAEPLEVLVDADCVCQAWITANRGLDQVEHKSMVTAAELSFEPAVTLGNVWSTLSRLHTLFEDRDLAAVRKQLTRLAKSETATRATRVGLDWLGRLDSGLAIVSAAEPRLGQRIEEVKAQLTRGAELFLHELEGGAGLVREELKHSSGRLLLIRLSHISARPVQRRGAWELQLRFTGEFGYQGRSMTRFEDVVLPRAVLPAPHALLELLLSDNPLASANMRQDRFDQRSFALEAARLVAKVEGHFEATVHPPTLAVRLPTPDLGETAVAVGIGELVVVRGEITVDSGPECVRINVKALEAGTPDHRLRGEVTLGITPREAGGDVATRCVEAAFDEQWPDESLALEVALKIQPGSSVEVLDLAMDIEQPLMAETSGLSLQMHGLTLDGEVAVSTGKPDGVSLLDRAAVNFRSDVDIPPGSHLEDGVMNLAPRLADGRISGHAERTADGGLAVQLEGQTGLTLDSTTRVDTFPEFDIDEGLLVGWGVVHVSFESLLRTSPLCGRVVDLDVSGTSAQLVVNETRLELGPRSLTLPAGSTVSVRLPLGHLSSTGIGEAVFEVDWDFQSASPVLSAHGRSVEIFVPELRQSRLTVSLSSVGGVTISGHEGGLYDARFFNALVNPGAEVERWFEILDDDDAMDKVLGTLRLFSAGGADVLDEIRAFAHRVRTILDQESIHTAGDFFPGHAVARVLSRILVDDDGLEERIFPLVKRVTDGIGLDVSATKRLLSEHLPDHDYEFELDRGLRIVARLLAPTEPLPPREPEEVTPLVDDPRYRERFSHLVSAGELYAAVLSAEPLPSPFSARVARVAPYLTLAQLDALLTASRTDWDGADLRKLRAVRAIKDRVHQIAESYGGMAFLPQAYAIGFFIGEAVRLRQESDQGPATAPGHEEVPTDAYDIAHGLLGPQEVGVLLQSGLASIWKGGPVQVNQRLLLEYVLRQPPEFLREVLVEMAGRSPRALTGVLYALLQLEQGIMVEPIDVAQLIADHLGVPVPRLADYMAGGRWARESHMEALSRTAELILAEAEPYLALKEYLQVVRHPVPLPIHEATDHRKLAAAARDAIDQADRLGDECTFKGNEPARRKRAAEAYEVAFAACRELRAVEPEAYSLDWFKSFWARNHEALVVLSVVRNHQQDIDQVRHWLKVRNGGDPPAGEQGLVTAVIDALYYFEEDRIRLGADPLVRLLLDPPPGRYDFTIISAMGVITEGAKGTELKDAYRRIGEQRGVRVLRADTQTARSLEFNADRIEDAVRQATTPWGYIGYSQGCANGLRVESLLLGGTPDQQALARKLRCRNLLFSAINGSAHGTCGDQKFLRAMIDGDRFLKHYQAVFSSKAIGAALDNIGLLLDSRPFVHSQGGVDSLSYAGIRALVRDGQFKADVPTSIMRGIVEPETTPEALEMLSNVLSKQIEQTDHDTQVTITEALGHPVWVVSPYGRVLKRCDMGCLVQRTHHWSPLYYATDFVTTDRDRDQAIYEFPKDRHVLPWVEVNARFGVIDRVEE
jgi:hypothetical protein